MRHASRKPCRPPPLLLASRTWSSPQLDRSGCTAPQQRPETHPLRPNPPAPPAGALPPLGWPLATGAAWATRRCCGCPQLPACSAACSLVRRRRLPGLGAVLGGAGLICPSVLPPPETHGHRSGRASASPPVPIASPLSGYHLGVLNTCEAHVEVDIGSGEAGANLVSLLLIGAALGSLVAGRLADRLGPR